jgi:hypothetical protein
MKWIVFILCFFILYPADAQVVRIQGSGLLERSQREPTRVVAPVLQTLRFDQGKVWINGNLLQNQQVPNGLQDRIGESDLYASFSGVSSVELVFEGRSYLVRPGRITDISALQTQKSGSDSDTRYMDRLSKSSPETFKGLTLEAELNRKTQTLTRTFLQTTDPRLRADLRQDLRAHLEKLFDLSIENQRKELEFLEKQIELRKEELRLKEAARQQHIARNLLELTDQK